jgi:hypothetical protein
MLIKMRTLLLASLLLGAVTGCSDSSSSSMGTGMTGAVPNDMETHGSGAMAGFGAANGDPVANTGNLGSGSAQSDPMNGVNQAGPAVPF